MKRIKIITALLLCYIVGFAQQNQYYINDVSVRDKVINTVAKTVKDDEKQAFYEKLIKESFDKYFSRKEIIYEINDAPLVKELQKKNKLLQDSISEINKTYIKEIKDLKKTIDNKDSQLDKANINGQLESQREQLEKDFKDKNQKLNDSIAILSSLVQQLQERSDLLGDTVQQQKREIAQLQEKSQIAINVNNKLDELLDNIDESYSSVYGSQTFEFTETDTIKNRIKAYKEYLELLGTNTPKETADKISYLEQATNAADLYHASIEYFKGKYNEDMIQKLLANYNFDTNMLNSGQDAELTRIKKALSEQKYSIRNFKNSILTYVETEGQILNDTKDKVKEGIQSKLSEFATFRGYNETTKYNSYYTSLNEALNTLLNGIDQVNDKGEKALEALIKQVNDMY